MQWSKIAGGGIVGVLGLLMGMQIAGAGGGGYLGAIATVGLTLAGIAFGVQMAEKYFPAQPATQSGNGPASRTPSHGPAQEPDKQNDVSTVSEDLVRTVRNSNIRNSTTTDAEAVTTALSHLGRYAPTNSTLTTPWHSSLSSRG